MTLTAIARDAFSAEPGEVRYLGGTLNQTAFVVVRDQRYFVKWKADAPPGFFAAEARGLALLRDVGPLRVPEVIHVAESKPPLPAYLILEWINAASQNSNVAFTSRFGYGLAQLHRVTQNRFGLDFDNFIGELPQSNSLTENWPDFYRDQRIAPQVELARRRGHLPKGRMELIDKLMARLPELLSGTEHIPALLHGDLWSGNFLAVNDQPVLIDPAVYYGEREIEIAFTELFGGFPAGFLKAYSEAYPLDPGYESRRALYQLYPLLVHLNMFGESYGSRVESICRHYVG